MSYRNFKVQRIISDSGAFSCGCIPLIVFGDRRFLVTLGDKILGLGSVGDEHQGTFKAGTDLVISLTIRVGGCGFRF